MSIDWEARHRQNIQYADNPTVGDYWDEMHSPIARVLMVNDKLVLVQKLAGLGGHTIDDANPTPVMMTRKEFGRWLRYDSIPDKTWACVTPGRYPPGYPK